MRATEESYHRYRRRFVRALQEASCDVRFGSKADIGIQLRNVRFVPSKLMSGAAGAIAALVLGPRYRPASRVKKQKQISPAGVDRKTAYDLPAPPAPVLKTQKIDTSVRAIFYCSSGKQPDAKVAAINDVVEGAGAATAGAMSVITQR